MSSIFFGCGLWKFINLCSMTTEAEKVCSGGQKSVVIDGSISHRRGEKKASVLSLFFRMIKLEQHMSCPSAPMGRFPSRLICAFGSHLLSQWFVSFSRHVQQSDAAMTQFELNLIDKLKFQSRVKTRHVHNSKASDSKSNTRGYRCGNSSWFVGSGMTTVPAPKAKPLFIYSIEHWTFSPSNNSPGKNQGDVWASRDDLCSTR